MPFRQTQSLTPEVRQRLQAGGTDLPNVEPLDLVWRPKERHLTFYGDTATESNVPISSCGLLRLNLDLGGELWHLGGIGGVITAASERGQGYGKRTVAEALRVLAEVWQVEAVALFCRPELIPFYQGFEFSLVEESVSILQPQGSITCPVPLMVRVFAERPWPRQPLVIDSLPW